MFDYTVIAGSGAKIPTITLELREKDISLARVILIPHSLQLYELHLSEVSPYVKGKMEAIGKAGFKFIFRDIVKLEKLMVMIPVHNRLAIKLAKKIMSYEGTLKNSFLFNNVMEDQEIYGISREDIKCL